VLWVLVGHGEPQSDEAVKGPHLPVLWVLVGHGESQSNKAAKGPHLPVLWVLVGHGESQSDKAAKGPQHLLRVGTRSHQLVQGQHGRLHVLTLDHTHTNMSFFG